MVASSAVEVERIWQTVFQPPVFDSAVFVARIRWQIALPAGVVAIGRMSGPLDYRWEIRNWLLTPEPAVSQEDLQRWSKGSDGTRPFTLAFAGGKASLEPMRIWHIPRQVWFLVCSGLVLAVGLVFGLSRLRLIFWAMVVVGIEAGIEAGLT